MEKLAIGRNAFVTGGSHGIGRGVALALAAEGYDISITYNTRKEDAEEVAHIITSEYGRKCYIFQASLEKEGVAEETSKAVIKEMGEVHVLVNNAGVTRRESIDQLTNEILNHLINLNFKSYLINTHVISKHMIENKIKGNIVSITSTRGFRAYPTDAVYGGLKAGIMRATESMALDLAPYGIRINCVAPGAIQVNHTPQAEEFYKELSTRIPLERGGKPEDIGNAVAFIVSDKASYITGTTLKVDGGLILPGMPERIQDDGYFGWGRTPVK